MAVHTDYVISPHLIDPLLYGDVILSYTYEIDFNTFGGVYTSGVIVEFDFEMFGTSAFIVPAFRIYTPEYRLAATVTGINTPFSFNATGQQITNVINQLENFTTLTNGNDVILINPNEISLDSRSASYVDGELGFDTLKILANTTDEFVRGLDFSRISSNTIVLTELTNNQSTELRNFEAIEFNDIGRISFEEFLNLGGLTFVSTFANEIFSGSPGLDTVTFNSILENFRISSENGGTVIVEGNGRDSLTDIERLQFSDGTLALDTSGNAGQTYRLYQAAFDRAPDTPGLSHNVNLMDNGLLLHDLSQGFIDSTEYTSRFGSDSSNTTFITALYQNVLDRGPDQVGFKYWSDLLASGQLDRADVLIGFSESPENIALVGSAIENGIWLG